MRASHTANTKFCLLGATFSTGNMGVGALTAGKIEAVLRQFPDAEICLLDYGKEPVTYQYHFKGKTIPVRLINIRFSKRVFLKNNIALLILLSLLIRLVPSKGLRKKLYSLNEYLKQIDSADIFTSIAGGDSFSDIYGMARLYYVSLPQLLVLSMGKDLFLLPQTLGPFKGVIARSIARFILKRAKAIYSRDYEGLKEMTVLLGKTDISGKLRFCYDVGFVMPPLKPQKTALEDINRLKGSGQPVVGINISGLLYMDGYTRNNMFGLRTDYRELMKDIIGLIIKEKKASVLLVPHVFGAGEENDAVACEKVHDELKPVYGDRISLLRGSLNQNEIKFVIGQCDFFIGARMHACIAALSQNIPAVSIAYSSKFKGVLNTIGAEALAADPRTMESKEILKLISAAYENRGLLREQLSRKMPEVRESVYSLVREICLMSLNVNAQAGAIAQANPDGHG